MRPGSQDFTVLRHLTRLHVHNGYGRFLDANAQEDLADLAALPDLRNLSMSGEHGRFRGVSSLTHLTLLHLSSVLDDPTFMGQLLPLTGLQRLSLSICLMTPTPGLFLPRVTQLFLMDITKVSRVHITALTVTRCQIH